MLNAHKFHKAWLKITDREHDTLIKTINLIIAPVVMITVCGIILNGLIGRYSWLSDRSRSVYQERLSLLELDLVESQSPGNSLRLNLMAQRLYAQANFQMREQYVLMSVKLSDD